MKLGAAIFLFSLAFDLAPRVSASEERGLRGNGNGKNNGNGNGNGNGGSGNGGSNENEEDASSPSPDYNDPTFDVEATADLLGLSFNEAEVLLQQQKDFSEVVASLQDDNAFLQAEMPDKPDGDFVIMFKNGNVPQQSLAKLDTFKEKNRKANVKTVASKLSLKGAEARGDRLAKKLTKKNFSHVSYSIDGDALELFAKRPQDDKGKGREKLPPGQAAELLGISTNDDDLSDLTLVLEDSDEDDPEGEFHTYGGRQIYGPNGQCTTGFSVIGSSGITGISTAAHCTGMNMYDAVPGESDYATSFQGQHNGFWGDVEWHTTSHIEPAEYYARASTRWPVRSIATSISKGEVVCGYSRRTGVRSCDTVYRTSVSQQGSDRLVAMKGNFMVPGDSGGPWSWYDKAYGIVKGYKTICDSSFLWIEWDCHRRATWTRASYFGPALGVVVRTQ